ncbi:TSL-kinase interacting protein 1 [Lactuca sativa]|uniref:Uncharacterized protein n=1 Tax=Lactuca sativa TaxID=4236 RepID=A0A9R1VTU6_LACSA|nr:TSL-kinase interacting protein 1 [Lactuca sativa]XP_052627282.1 TSL-kinase interacting protein 1 [Lactuca sativa]KAJ0210765.1 hypothetical protein LSAT_V11C400163280 [Lactuca sativa]
MTCKWGSSTVAASGELKRVPYDAQTSNLSNSQKWNQDSALIWSPLIFHLRYGWFGKGEERNNINNGIGIGVSVGMGLSTLEWVDSLTNIIVCDMLSEVSHNIVGPTPCHQQISYNCDSFDVAIAAYINKNHHAKNNGFHSTNIQSSIYDAEETCDAFSFSKNTEKLLMIPSSSLNQKLREPAEPKECEFDENHIPVPKDLTSLTDMYWLESSGHND